MPREHFDSHQFLAKKEILSYEELTTVVESLIPLGLTKVRLTGGEPLLRKDVCSFIKMLPPQLDLAMTTNGILLEKFAQDLADAGLNRVTVSLDALDVETFQTMGDTNEKPETVLRGIEAARKAGLSVKVNTVIRAGYNEHSVQRVAERFIGSDVVVRYIEFMDVGETNSWNDDEVITGEMMRKMLENIKPIKANHLGEVANRYIRGTQELGFIESVSAVMRYFWAAANVSGRDSGDPGRSLKTPVSRRPSRRCSPRPDVACTRTHSLNTKARAQSKSET